ncbi:MAG: class I SAM-dependent rRNA methyltransferase [Verrucomicrobiota bacterium]
MAGIVVKPRARILHGHDWVFAGEVLKTFGNPRDGDVISLKDGRDHLIGSAIYNSKSQIVARRFSRRRQDLDLDFFQRRIAQAVEYRKRRGVNLKICRLVWSESDGLPGVIIDRYGDHLVLQTLTLAMDMRKALIVEALKSSASFSRRCGTNLADTSSKLAPLSIIERNDAVVRRAEGLELQVGVLEGDASSGPVIIEINGTRPFDSVQDRPRAPLQFEIDLLHAQKTGFYLDQLAYYEIIARHAAGRRVLDCFTSQGAFALTCARAAAAKVTAVETSAESLAVARRNAERNGLQVEWIEQDVFSFLRAAEKAEMQYDLIILDPPSFTKTKDGLRDALRGYHELHVRAFKLLSKDGLLATFSCSYHVSETIFNQTIAGALVDARRSARRLRRFEQALDHPVVPTIPETEYFRGVLLEMMPGR